MAINKKLKKFNDNGSYRSFLTTTDFERPDASSIYSAATPTNIAPNPLHTGGSTNDFFINVPNGVDLEYNPKCMLLVNCKYYINPTATTISPIVDTITNGTIGCWWRYTTASTWTKLNSTDVIFYSGYTQNKITNITFNTIGTSNLRNDSNVEYMFSAHTDSSTGSSCETVSYKLTDNCIQLGLITIDNVSFAAEGESKSVQVHTAPENPWQITNPNSWLSFSSLTGVGPTTLTVTASPNTSTNSRIGNITLEYTNVSYSTTGTLTQAGEQQSFIWNNSSSTAITVNLDWDDTIVNEPYTNSYHNLSVQGSTSWVTARNISNVSGNGFFTASTQQNTTLSSRNYTFNIQNNGTTVGTVQVVQSGKPASYFYVGNTLAEATTTACTYASTVSSASGSYLVYYNTNYTTPEINTLTFQSDSMFLNVSFDTTAGTINFVVDENPINSPARSGIIWVKSGTTNIAKIEVDQHAGEVVVDYFYWGDGSTSATTSAGTADYNSTSISCNYVTNYSSLTTAINGSWINSATLNNGVFTVNFDANSTYVQRTGSINIMNGSTIVGRFNVTQRPAPTPDYFYWGDGSDSATTTGITIESAGTPTTVIPYVTSYSNLTTASTDNWITGITLNNGNFTAGFVDNPDTSGRTGVVNIMYGSDVVGSVTVTQKAKAYFHWSNNTTSITKSIASTTTSDTTNYYTNYDNLSVVSAGSYTWVTQKGITNLTGDGVFSATTQQNNNAEDRTAVFNVLNNAATVGQLTLTQAGTGITYTLTAYTGTTGTDTSITVDATGDNFTVRVLSNQAWSASSSDNWATLSSTAGTNDDNITVTVSSYAGTTNRPATLTFTGEHGQICYITITQNAYVPPVVTYNFKWNETNDSYITISDVSDTGGSGTKIYSYTGYTDFQFHYGTASWLDFELNKGNNSVRYTVDPNYNPSSRSDFDYIDGLKQDGTWDESIGRITVSQIAGTPYFEWEDNHQTAITPTSLDSGGTGAHSYEDFLTDGYSNVGYNSSDKPNWLTISMNSYRFSYTAATQSEGAPARDPATIRITASTYGTIGEITINQDAGAEPKRLTAVTITINSAPDIPCTGGNVTSGQVSYTATAEYSNGDTTPAPTVRGSATVSIGSWGNQQSDSKRTAGTITLTASCTFDGVTLTDTDSIEIEQAANPITASAQTGTGTTEHESHNGTKTGTVSYSISCQPTTTGVTSGAGYEDVEVTATKDVPTTAYTYDTWYQTTSYTATLCTGAQIPWTETGTTEIVGPSSITETYIDSATTGYSVTKTSSTWNSYGKTGDTVRISYNENTNQSPRSVTYTFSNTGNPNVYCTCVLTQDAGVPAPTATSLTIYINQETFGESYLTGTVQLYKGQVYDRTLNITTSTSSLEFEDIPISQTGGTWLISFNVPNSYPLKFRTNTGNTTTSYSGSFSNIDGETLNIYVAKTLSATLTHPINGGLLEIQEGGSAVPYLTQYSQGTHTQTSPKTFSTSGWTDTRNIGFGWDTASSGSEPSWSNYQLSVADSNGKTLYDNVASGARGGGISMSFEELDGSGWYFNQ